MTRKHIIRPLAAALTWLSATTSALRARALLWPWMTQSVKLFIGTLTYNAFALIVVEPLLKKWFPPLRPWEHVTGALSGHSRTTYEQIVPVVATTLWILGNALLFALMKRNLRPTQATIAAGGAMTRLEPEL